MRCRSAHPSSSRIGRVTTCFDLTKVWPHSDYPLIEVGELVLDCNPENYCADVEQAAFEPKNALCRSIAAKRFVQGTAAFREQRL